MTSHNSFARSQKLYLFRLPCSKEVLYSRQPDEISIFFFFFLTQLMSLSLVEVWSRRTYYGVPVVLSAQSLQGNTKT